MQHTKIPTLDLSLTPRADAVRVFGEGLEHFGFVTVIGHGVSHGLLTRAYDLSRRAFALPEEAKRACEQEGHFTGFVPFGTEHAKDDPRPDLKEFWEVRKYVPEELLLFPKELPDFGPMSLSLFDALEGLAQRLMRLLDDHLGMPAGHFGEMIRESNTLMRILHYPEIVGRPDAMRSAPHEDINFVTLLVAATAAGLEVKTRDGTWIPVTNPPDAIVVNSGDMLKAYTGGRIPSTTHRVVNGDGKPRYSIPFFVHPRPEVVLMQQPRLTAGEYLDQRLREIGLK
ncbi:MAG TPA: 2-oxoglutarate and iron-dependent oxygenase domain-containing protein [Candidatus Binatia bacterium]|nr:2-oxoglutarate and iron-dependent oxygenase domain-containing protein [Candidatus Binatia bacterium]